MSKIYPFLLLNFALNIIVVDDYQDLEGFSKEY